MKKKLPAMLIAASMLMSMTSCELGGKKAEDCEDDILDLAGEVMDSYFGLKAKKLTKCVDEDDAEDIEEALDELDIDPDFETEESKCILKAIFDTYEYEIDEDSVEIDTRKGEASVDVVCTHVDADAVAEDPENTGYYADFIDALADSKDTTEVKLTLEFEQNDDDEWILTNCDDLLDLASEAEYEIEFGAFVSADNIESWYWDGADEEGGNVYTNTSRICLVATPKEEYVDLRWDYVADIYYEGELIHTINSVSIGTDLKAECAIDGPMEPGEYRITFTANGVTFLDETCEVVAENMPTAQPTPTDAPDGDNPDGELPDETCDVDSSLDELVGYIDENGMYKNEFLGIQFDASKMTIVDKDELIEMTDSMIEDGDYDVKTLLERSGGITIFSGFNQDGLSVEINMTNSAGVNVSEEDYSSEEKAIARGEESRYAMELLYGNTFTINSVSASEISFLGQKYWCSVLNMTYNNNNIDINSNQFMCCVGDYTVSFTVTTLDASNNTDVNELFFSRIEPIA